MRASGRVEWAVVELEWKPVTGWSEDAQVRRPLGGHYGSSLLCFACSMSISGSQGKISED